MTDSDLSRLLEFAQDLAYRAGRQTLAHFNTGIKVEWKADRSPVTQADHDAERLIRSEIQKYYPTHAIIGEEFGQTDGDDDYRWIIDPIDGTKSFIHGVPFYAVLIGLEIRQNPALGVVYLPGLDEMVSAAIGQGCVWNGRKCRVSSVDRLEDAALMTTNIDRCNARSDAYGNLSEKVRLTRTWGDAYGYVLVATGRAEIMLDSAMHPWDCAPLLPIIVEAGGHFADWQGNVTIWGKDAFATNAALYDQVLPILQNERVHTP